ncbi:hypothetical protein LXA43DRAFT_902541 [Ganoderma leucocontextum]|nr:hypothetical protein LXA43DRAFT_902541 [Ganoderma leucocontextum]
MSHLPPTISTVPQGMRHVGLPTSHPVDYYSDGNTVHDVTGGLPINLDSLRDGRPGTKPFYPYATLIRYAIKGSPTQKLLLEDIYYAIESRFPYFKTAPSGWKNSVRHTLSLNPCFDKVPRPLTHRGKGSYWTVNDNVNPRTGVRRIRNKKANVVSTHSLSAAVQVQDADYGQGVDMSAGSGAGTQFLPPPCPPQMDHRAEERSPSQPPGSLFVPLCPTCVPPFHPPPILLFRPNEQFEVDDVGVVNWRGQWQKDLAQLQEMTAEQESAGTDQDWYRHLVIRLRTAMMAPPITVTLTGEPMLPPMYPMPAPLLNPVEVSMCPPLQEEE